MKIGIALNDVIRDYLGQLEYTCNKYFKHGKSDEDKYSLEDYPITEFDLVKYFNFDSKKSLNTFLFEEASLEIYGHASEMSTGLMRKFNTFLMDIEDDEEHEVYLISREAGASIPSTFFFLSKTICKAKNIKFYHNYVEQWDDYDVIITANPEVLNNKPDGKISVKVLTPYNTEVESDFELTMVEEFFDDEDLRNNILIN